MGLGILLELPLFIGVALYIAGCTIIGKQVFSQWKSLDRRHRLAAITVFVGLTLFLGGFLNFLAFSSISMAIGGSADAIENGHYFVSSHGKRTEVSKDRWLFVFYHERSVRITHPLGAIGIGMMLFAKKIFRLPDKSLHIAIEQDGSILIEGKKTELSDVVARAKWARDLRQPIYIQRQHYTDETSATAKDLYEAFLANRIFVQNQLELLR